MTPFRAAALLLPLLALPFAAAQDGESPQEREERIRRRIEKELEKELRGLGDSLAATVRAELSGGSLDKALGLVTEELLRGHAGFLASDELEGRNAGYPGNDKASDYVAGVMKKAGLAPVGDKDAGGRPTYFQHFQVFGRKTRNCLGLLEGTDPELKREIVVVGGHHDHVGTESQGHWGRLGRAKEDDTIWNGADDNASGTTTVLGLIKAFGEGGVRARRSILFMTFSGEEGGLIGSAYYARHPFTPIENHVFMLNLDMVGRNPEKPVEIAGFGSAEGGVLKKAAEEAASRAGLEAKFIEKAQIFGGDSDHTSFKNARVPITFFFTGFHPDYHKVTDTPEKLDYPNMVKIARTAAYLAKSVADLPERPVFSGKGPRNDFDFDPPVRPAPQARRTLGIKADDLDAEAMQKFGLGPKEGGIKVTSVTPGSSAEKAGVKADDILISLGGTTLDRKDPLGGLRKALDAVVAGQETPLVVIREGQRVTLKAAWDK